MTDLMKSDPASNNLNYGTIGLRVFLTLLVVAMGVLWVYAFFLAPAGNPDRMEDRSWPEAAQVRCLAARAEIALLPTARQAGSPDERAKDLDEATVIIRNLVNDLVVLPGGTDHDRSLVALWIADWEIYLADRLAHAERLRSDGDVKPLLTALPSGSGSVLERMNGFARVNDFEACLDPGDM
ncbi:MAG: hypothetical protein P8M16_00135 [Acidimicrobiales bacterium]|nr:hypothetical protein [Acidimicrobiales bacterium]